MTRSTAFYRSPSFWVATLLAAFAIAPFVQPGYFWGAHDARHNVFFLLQYDISWQEGVFFPRWSPDWAFGYGYPFFNIYAPGATFIGVALHQLLALSYEAAVEGVFALSILISAWGMWFFVRDWRGERAALVAAVAYVYVPYHLVDVYVRAAMAESLALAFLPWVLWGARRAALKPGWPGIIALVLTYAALHLSSNLVALIFTPVLALYILTLALGAARQSQSERGRAGMRAIARPVIGIALGIALAAFFILPAVLEARYVRLDQWFGGYYDFHEHYVYFAQLFDPGWGFGISQPGPNDPISYQLGLAPFLLAAIALWVWLRRGSAQRLETGFWLIVLAASVWLTTAASTWAWDHIPLVSAAQFPWRYLTLAALALAILAPTVLPASTTDDARGWTPALLLSGLLILGSAAYVRVEITPPPPGGATLAGLMEFERSSNEMTGMTITADEIPTWSPLADLHMAGIPIGNQVNYELVHSNPNLAVDVREHSVSEELLWVRAEDADQRVPFYRQWYPGWTATVLDPTTGEELAHYALSRDDTLPPYGLLNVPVPAGEHLLRLSFENTPIRRVGNALSLIAVVVIAGLLLAHLIRRRTS